MSASWIHDNWARETELKKQCADCACKTQDDDWFACDHDDREFPVAEKCLRYLPEGLDE